MADIIVKKSRIHGKGIFAARSYKKGEIVLKWNTSHKLTKEDAQKLSEKEKAYIDYVKGKFILMQPPEKFVNHSCNANTFVKNFSDVAKRSIKKGEEVTSDYGKYGFSNFKCKCGNKNCREFVKSGFKTRSQPSLKTPNQ